MTAENPIPLNGGSKEFKLILPTLLPPAEGVFDEVYMDYLADPERFKVALEYRLNTDNPDLITFFKNYGVIPNPNLSSKWACIYYGMLERAAKKEGLPPLRVSQRIVDSYIKLSLVRAGNGFETNQEEETMERIKSDWEKRKNKDKSFSPELAKFWQSVEGDIEKMREEEGEDYEIDMIHDVLSVVSIQTVLQTQQDEYSLIGRYEF